MINFVFEDLGNFTNFLNCKDVNPSTIRRFGPSPISLGMIFFKRANKFSMENAPENYIISAGVNHSPNDWAKPEGCLTYLTEKQLHDVKQGRAMVLFDQSFEGYQTPWLWEYFHVDCQRNNINPKSLIYVTGNMLAEQQYSSWAESNNILNRIKVISYTHFENDVYQMARTRNLGYEQQKNNLEYKRTNVDKIAAYNCLQKRLRAHRIWFYNYLFRENLLEHGLVSMNPFEISKSYFEGRWLDESEAEKSNLILPLKLYGKNNNEFDDNFYISRITDNVFKDSWVSVISEASFGDSEQTIFLSEKLFKPIACFHPFIVVGNRGSLKKLKEMGYKTFEGFIDESYDDLPTFERFEAIIKELKRIISIEDKLSWFESMQDILEHNYNTLEKNSNSVNPSIENLKAYYGSYFQQQ